MMKRMAAEIRELAKCPTPGCSAGPVGEDLAVGVGWAGQGVGVCVCQCVCVCVTTPAPSVVLQLFWPYLSIKWLPPGTHTHTHAPSLG